MKENSNLYNIVLLGRPNVGKSSIFNFFVSKNEAKVENEEGTTIDWRSKTIKNIKLWDSPGTFKLNNINIKINKIFFVIDNIVLNSDKQMYLELKKKYEVLTIINKIDQGEDVDYSFFKDQIKISLKSGYNLSQLRNEIIKLTKEVPNKEKKTWAIIGKPNVGKSSIINKLVKFNLHKVEDKEGTTKELLPVNINSNILLDTPGQREKPIFPRYNDIFGVIIVTDLNCEKQDLKLINLIKKRNKPLFLVVNKLDLVKNEKKLKEIIERFKKFFIINVIKISCLKNQGIDKIIKEMKKLEQNFHKRIKTKELNTWLEQDIRKVEPKLKFISQVETGFPKFYCDYKLTVDKEKMLIKKLSEKFDFIGIPCKIITKQN